MTDDGYRVPLPEPEPFHGASDEALAAAIAETRPGGYIVIHADTCAVEYDERCTCEPIRMGPLPEPDQQ